MAKTYALAGLHLRYRLWIAELNHYIDIIRISQDYCVFEEKDKLDAVVVSDGIEYFNAKFIELRREIDDVRNRLHLLKMKIAADAKEVKEINQKTYISDSHAAIKKQMLTFKTTFNGIINEFCRFEKRYF